MIIIDGHNLIGASKDIRLSDPNAKDLLLVKLLEYQKILQRKLVVVFDGKSFGEFEKLDFHGIEIRYPVSGESADQTIIKLIEKYNNQPGICIVSSDRDIQNSAKRAHLATQTSTNFYNEIEETILQGNSETEKYLSPVNTDEWLDYFNNKKNNS